MDRNHLNNFERGSTKDHSCEIWSKSNQLFRRRCRLNIVNGWTDGQTDDDDDDDDGRWVITITHLERLAQVSLKGKRKVQGVPQSQTEAFPRHQEEEETDKSKQAQTKQTYEKHQD